jgi:16S rRNA processing protein RimM
VVGLVRGVHGLNGALRVEILTDRPEARFARGAVLYREGSGEPLTVNDAVAIPDGPGWRVRFKNVGDRAAADALRGAYLEADVPPGDEPGRGAAYWHEVVGTPVRGIDGEELGTVADIYRVGENDVYVVRGGPRGEFDVPAVRDFIRIFAPRRGEIVVDAAALELGPVRPPKPPRPPRPGKGDKPRTRLEAPRDAGSEAGSKPGTEPEPEPETGTPGTRTPTEPQTGPGA